MLYSYTLQLKQNDSESHLLNRAKSRLLSFGTTLDPSLL